MEPPGPSGLKIWSSQGSSTSWTMVESECGSCWMVGSAVSSRAICALRKSLKATTSSYPRRRSWECAINHLGERLKLWTWLWGEAPTSNLGCPPHYGWTTSIPSNNQRVPQAQCDRQSLSFNIFQLPCGRSSAAGCASYHFGPLKGGLRSRPLKGAAGQSRGSSYPISLWDRRSLRGLETGGLCQ